MFETKRNGSFFENRKSDLMQFFQVMLALIHFFKIDNYESLRKNDK